MPENQTQNNVVKLSPTLFIGVGGTGMDTILKTKAMMVDCYGEVPPMLGFLGMDTDQEAYNKTIQLRNETVQFQGNEKCDLSVPDAASLFSRNRRNMTWIPNGNDAVISSMTKGAGQVRSNGRLALILKLTHIKSAITDAMSNISNTENIDNTKYAVVAGAIQVNMVFSIGGGTGCGSFLDLAYIVRETATAQGMEVSINGYAVLPQVFKEMVPNGSAMMRVKPNAFGALCDLDFMMHLSRASAPMSLDWFSENYLAVEKPFDLCFLIDNVNSVGTKYDDISEITDVIGLQLAALTSPIGATLTSAFDNIKHAVSQGDLDVKNKKAWVCSTGAAEVVFKGSEIADVYAHKVVLALIQQVTNTTTQGNERANAWINDQNIRENNGQDQVINRFRPQRISDFEILDEEGALNPMSEVSNFMDRFEKDINTQAEQAKQALLETVNRSLTTAIAEILNGSNACVSLSADMLDSIENQVDLFMRELTEEKTELEADASRLEESIGGIAKDLQDHAQKHKLFGKKKQKNFIADLQDTTDKFARKQLDILIRIHAIQFYTKFLEDVHNLQEKIRSLQSMLSLTKRELSNKLDEYSNVNIRSKIMEVNLMEMFVSKVNVEENVLNTNDISVFLTTNLNSSEHPSLLDIADSRQLKQLFFKFAKERQEYNEWYLNRDINYALSQLTPDEFRNCYTRVLAKALPLLGIQSKGHVTKNTELPITQALGKHYVIGVPPQKNKCRFFTDEDFKQSLTLGEEPQYIETGFMDRIIVSQIEHAVPPCCISGVEQFERECNKSNLKCYVNQQIFDRMCEEGYSIYPAELEDRILSLWVQAIIFGFVEFDRSKGNGSYKFKDFSNPDLASSDCWVNVRSYYRNVAYEEFSKREEAFYTSLETKLEDLKQEMGRAQVNNLIDVVCWSNNYKRYFAQFYTVSEFPKKSATPEEVAQYKKDLLAKLVSDMNAGIQTPDKTPKNTVARANDNNLLNQEVNYVKNSLKKDI